VDEEAEALLGLLPRLKCGPACADCCPPDLTVLGIEAAWIRRAVGDSLRGAAPGEEARCAFLDERHHCRIYPFRPYVCRTQGLPFRWWEEDEAGEIQESRDVCPLNAGALSAPSSAVTATPPGIDLPLSHLTPDQCWLLGPREERLVELEEARNLGRLERVELRRLFQELSRDAKR
jgi:Fe-S-cluster containining protein